MRTFFLALVFVAELAAWAAFGVVVYLWSGGGVTGWVAAAVTVAVVIALWAVAASPRASAPGWARIATKVVVFGGAIALLVIVIGYLWPAVALLVLAVVAHAGVALTGGSPTADEFGDGPRRSNRTAGVRNAP